MSSLLFTEEKQLIYNRWVSDLDEKISEDCSDYSYFESVFETQLKDMAKCGNECFLRLTQATITEFGQNGGAAEYVDVFACWLIYYFRNLKANIDSYPDVDKMVELLHLNIDSVDPSDEADVRVRNICMLLSIVCQIMYTINAELEALFTDQLVSFLVKVVLHNTSYTLLYALMCFVPFSVVDELKDRHSNQLSLALILQRLSSTAEEFNLNSVFHRSQSYVLRFRIGACAQWLLDHLFGSEHLPAKSANNNKDYTIKLLTAKKFDDRKKVTCDNYSAFGCDFLWQSYQCSEGIDPQSGDVFYYEAILFTKGSIRVGWTLKMENVNFEDSNGFQNLPEAISFDPYEKRIKVQNVEKNYDKLLPVQPCDVVGCLLDTSASTFKFFVNGKEVPHTWTLPQYKLRMGLYYPTAGLSAYQQVYFNFGQAPFQFAPSDVKLCTIFTKVKNTPEVIDTRQEKFNEWMWKFDLSVLESGSHDYEMEDLRMSLLKLVKCEGDWIKLVRSMITELGCSADDRVDVRAMWMMSYSKLLQSQPPSPDKVIQLIQPYLESYLNESSRVTNEVSIRLRNICILLSIMPQIFQSRKLKSFLTPSVVKTLVKLVSATNRHNSSKLYALFCMQSFTKSPTLKKHLHKRDDLQNSLKINSRKVIQVASFARFCWDYELFQINVLSTWLYDHVFGEYDDGQSVSSSLKMRTSNDGFELKVSRDGLSAIRCYYGWVDYQSEFHSISDIAYFYEVVLMTSGSARVGWTLSNETNTIDWKGMASNQESVFFDAYEKSIYIDGKRYSIERPQTVKSPKPGTVIGCLLHTSARTFKFYVNGKEVPHTWTMPEKLSSSEHYYPIAGLSAYQQVYFNFGQAPFQFAPSDVKFHAICGKVKNTAEVIDTRQEKFNEWMWKFDLSVLESGSDDYEMEDLRLSLLELVKCEGDWIKLVRSMITELGCSADYRVDVMSMRMMSYIKLLMLPTLDKVIQLVQPYLESFLKETSQVTKEVSNQLRNICILLSILPQVFPCRKFESFLTANVVNTLVKLVSVTNRHNTSKLFCPKNLENSKQKLIIFSQFNYLSQVICLLDEPNSNRTHLRISSSANRSQSSTRSSIEMVKEFNGFKPMEEFKSKRIRIIPGEPEAAHNIVVVGNDRVGKSTTFAQLELGGTITNQYIPSIQVEAYRLGIRINEANSSIHYDVFPAQQIPSVTVPYQTVIVFYCGPESMASVRHYLAALPVPERMRAGVVRVGAGENFPNLDQRFDRYHRDLWTAADIGYCRLAIDMEDDEALLLFLDFIMSLFDSPARPN